MFGWGKPHTRALHLSRLKERHRVLILSILVPCPWPVHPLPLRQPWLPGPLWASLFIRMPLFPGPSLLLLQVQPFLLSRTLSYPCPAAPLAPLLIAVVAAVLLFIPLLSALRTSPRAPAHPGSSARSPRALTMPTLLMAGPPSTPHAAPHRSAHVWSPSRRCTIRLASASGIRHLRGLSTYSELEIQRTVSLLLSRIGVFPRPSFG